MQPFQFRDQIIQYYRDFVSSYFHISDPNIKKFVEDEINQGYLWPEPLIQLNLSYQQGKSITELVQSNQLHPDLQKIFKSSTQPFYLRQHQEDALHLALQSKSFVVITGTGSGKSLTYLLPIFNDILNHPEKLGVRAILVYPMNALINSQEEEIAKYLKNAPELKDRITFARYTGQESKEEKEKRLNQLPHILLTNYVMLELMLTRQDEKRFFEKLHVDFLILDELHTYRGRQGADVSILVRRLKERIKNSQLLCIGTSATMTSEGGSLDRKKAVASTASRLFGTSFSESEIIEETFKRVTTNDDGLQPHLLRTSLENFPLSFENAESVKSHPLASWIELNIALKFEHGQLVRNAPQTMSNIIKQLMSFLNINFNDSTLYKIYAKQIELFLNEATRHQVFAYRLHQFISQGGMVYSTIESKPSYSLNGQTYSSTNKLQYPVVFCRDCGHPYFLACYNEKDSTLKPYTQTRITITADSDLYYGDWQSNGWSGDIDDLPEAWLKYSEKKGYSVKEDFVEYIPKVVYMNPEGKIKNEPQKNYEKVVLHKAPFLFCESCGRTYQRSTSEFSKLSRLSNEGRSTATTILSMHTVQSLIKNKEESAVCKVLSFTDNRQDASLQAGHFNDFIQVLRLRMAIYSALRDSKKLTYSNISQKVAEKMNLDQLDYAQEIGEGKKAEDNYRTFLGLLEYMIYQDLKHDWKFIQPNLEQVGLLEIEFEGLQELCTNELVWQHASVFSSAKPTVRYSILLMVLKFFCRSFALRGGVLNDGSSSNLDKLKRFINDRLNIHWQRDDSEHLEETSRVILPTEKNATKTKPKVGIAHELLSISPRSSLGKYLKDKRTWGDSELSLTNDVYIQLVAELFEILCKQGFLKKDSEGYALDLNCLIWVLTDKEKVELNPLKTIRKSDSLAFEIPVNSFYKQLYKQDVTVLSKLRAGEHTGQVKNEQRIEREKNFREGKLNCLYCSPTMELGIDISSLNVVHMRNVPPSPSRYAQRSGRAGRAGQGAVVITYASQGSPHDMYYFKRQVDMVSGTVVAPRIELQNPHLWKTHIHSQWLYYTGLDLNRNIAELFDLQQDEFPIAADKSLQMKLDKKKQLKCIESCKYIFFDNQRLFNLPLSFIEETLQQAENSFNLALNFWRQEYRNAKEQSEFAEKEIKKANMGVQGADRSKAEMQRRDAERRIKLLIGENKHTQDWGADFYPYRYLATQGFLPGYNFPSSPVKVLINKFDEVEYLNRARFQAIREYAPYNVIYYEGNQYRIDKMEVRQTEFDSLLTEVKTCNSCNYLMKHKELNLDICPNCQHPLGTDFSTEVHGLIYMQTMSTRRVSKITCEEEERLKNGYLITTNFRLPEKVLKASINDKNGKEIFHLTYGQATEIWLINHGLKASGGKGFKIEPTTGKWISDDNIKKKNVDKTHKSDGESNLKKYETVKLCVEDKQNALIIKFSKNLLKDSLCLSLRYALVRAIEINYQLEENEITSEFIDSGDGDHLLIWESVEGGVGVLERLMTDAESWQRIADKALELCHFSSSDKQESTTACVKACYECLLSYTNQTEHVFLDRHQIESVLRELKECTIERIQQYANGKDRKTHYEYLLTLVDKRSQLEELYLTFLYENELLLPTNAQEILTDLNIRPDFIFKIEGAKGICVFCNGSVHDSEEQQKRDANNYEELRDRGYRVEIIDYKDNWKEKVLKKKGDIY